MSTEKLKHDGDAPPQRTRGGVRKLVIAFALIEACVIIAVLVYRSMR